jgi:hypothetical protein
VSRKKAKSIAGAFCWYVDYFGRGLFEIKENLAPARFWCEKPRIKRAAKMH